MLHKSDTVSNYDHADDAQNDDAQPSLVPGERLSHFYQIDRTFSLSFSLCADAAYLEVQH